MQAREISYSILKRNVRVMHAREISYSILKRNVRVMHVREISYSILKTEFAEIDERVNNKMQRIYLINYKDNANKQLNIHIYL